MYYKSTPRGYTLNAPFLMPRALVQHLVPLGLAVKRQAPRERCRASCYRTSATYYFCLGVGKLINSLLLCAYLIPGTNLSGIVKIIFVGYA